MLRLNLSRVRLPKTLLLMDYAEAISLVAREEVPSPGCDTSTALSDSFEMAVELRLATYHRRPHKAIPMKRVLWQHVRAQSWCC